MAGIKISALPAVPSAALTDIFPVVQGGVTSQESLTQVLALFQGKITSLGAQTAALNMNTHLINGVVDPVSAQDAATKHYVDAASALDVLLNPSADQSIIAHNLFLTNGGFISGSATGPVSSAAGTIQAVGVNRQGIFNIASYINASGSSPSMFHYKSRSTTVGSFTTVQTSDTLGRWLLFGDDGTQFTQAAQMVWQASGTISAGVVPCLLTLQTANGSGVLTTAFTVDQNQVFTLTNPLAAGSGGTGLSSLGSGIATWLGTPSSANLLAAMTTKTGTGNLVFATSPTLVTPTLGAASATSITFSSTSGIIGSTTNDSAAAGSVGELISSVIAQASAVSLTNNTSRSITSISLTAGDWDVYGNVNLNGAAGTLLQYYSCWVGLSASTPDPSLWAGQSYGTGGVAVFAENQVGDATPFIRVSVSTTTTVFLGIVAGFAVSTATACGGIFARRAR